MHSRSSKSFRNVLVGLGVQAIETVLKFVSRTIFIRTLSISYLGVNGLFTEVLTMFSLAELGLGGAMGYALYKPLHDDDKEKIASLMQFYRNSYMVIGCCVLLIGCLFSPFLRSFIKQPDDIKESIVVIYFIYLFNVVFSYFLSYRFTLLTSDQKTYVIQSVKAGISITRTIIQAAILICWHSFYAYLAAEAILIFINNIFLYTYVGKHYPYLSDSVPKLPRSEKRSIFINIKALSIYKITTLLVNSTENTLIGIFVGLKEVGYYSNYLIFVYLGTTFMSSIFGNISPSVGSLNAENDTRRSMEVFKAIHLMNFWLYGLFGIGLIVCLEPLISIWLGEEFLLGMPMVLVIASNFYIKGMQNAVWVFKDTYGLFRYGQYTAIVQAVLHLSLASFMGWKFGMIGILMAAGIARLSTTVWYDPMALFIHGFKVTPWAYYASYFAYAMLLIGTGFLTYYLALAIPCNNLLGLFGKAIMSLLMPNLIFLLYFWSKPEFKLIQARLSELVHSKLKAVFA